MKGIGKRKKGIYTTSCNKKYRPHIYYPYSRFQKKNFLDSDAEEFKVSPYNTTFTELPF